MQPVGLSQSVSIMSQKLLQGYAMLADSCPDCGVPLLREPGGGSVICVNCIADSGTQVGDQAGQESQQEGASAATEAQQATKPAPGHQEEDEESLLEPPPALSRQLGVEQQGGAASNGRGLRTAAAAASGDAVSKQIADKMLEGWALLDDSCPRCHTVLVRNRQRQMFCVGCDMFVVREQSQQQQQQDEQSKQEQQQLQRQDGSESTVTNGAVASVPAISAPAGQATSSPQLRPHSKAEPLPTGVPGELLWAAERPGSAVQAAGAGTQHAYAAADSTSLATGLQASAAAVGAKLRQAAEELPGADTQQAQRLVVLIQSCAEALSALEGCKRKLAGS